MSHCREEDIRMSNRHMRQRLTLVIRKIQIQEHRYYYTNTSLYQDKEKIKPRQYQCLVRICNHWYNLSETVWLCY